jgi:hypothetical protein
MGILVVTDSHDLDEARDILETILATDLADIPATGQRRQLAHQHRQPALQPRCTTPTGSMTSAPPLPPSGSVDATDSLARSEAKRGPLRPRSPPPRNDSPPLNEACEPYDAAVETACEAVAAAREARRAAHVRLSDCGLRHRQARRVDLSLANDQLGRAEQKLADAYEQAAPINRQRSEAQRDLAAARDALRTEDMWDRWNYHPERLRDAETRRDALDTWKQWAPEDTMSTATNSPAPSKPSATARRSPPTGTLALANAIRRFLRWVPSCHGA